MNIDYVLPTLPAGNNPIYPQPKPIKKVRKTKIRRKGNC